MSRDIKDAIYNKKVAAGVPWSHVVKKGQTLSGIAKTHGVSVSAIKSANNIKGTMIRIGQVLQIPLSGSGSYRVATASYTHDGFYIVKKGDTLWQIARRHNMTTAALLSLNNLNKNSIIQPGQRLRVKTKKVKLTTRS